jgi:hypothetical protein
LVRVFADRTCVRLVVEMKRGERSVVPVVGGKAVQTGVRFKSWVFQESGFSRKWFFFRIRNSASGYDITNGGTRQALFVVENVGSTVRFYLWGSVPVAFAFRL